jgi:hypothetical protein
MYHNSFDTRAGRIRIYSKLIFGEHAGLVLIGYLDATDERI